VCRTHWAFTWTPHFVTDRTVLLVVAVSLLALGGAAGSPNAVASCGDWLSHASGTATRPVSEKSTRRHDAVVRLTDASTPTKLRVPCRGHFCGQAPSRPMTPSTPVTSTAVPEPALLCSSVAVRTYRLPDSMTAALEARPTKGFPTRIDHPPRA
jgi:hypothetical protein